MTTEQISSAGEDCDTTENSTQCPAINWNLGGDSFVNFVVLYFCKRHVKKSCYSQPHSGTVLSLSTTSFLRLHAVYTLFCF